MKVKLRSKYFTENKTLLERDSFLHPCQLQETKQVKALVSIYSSPQNQLPKDSNSGLHSREKGNLQRHQPISKTEKPPLIMSSVGLVIKCVWFEAPIAQNLSANSLANQYGASRRAGGVGQIAFCVSTLIVL